MRRAVAGGASHGAAAFAVRAAGSGERPGAASGQVAAIDAGLAGDLEAQAASDPALEEAWVEGAASGKVLAGAWAEDLASGQALAGGWEEAVASHRALAGAWAEGAASDREVEVVVEGPLKELGHGRIRASAAEPAALEEAVGVIVVKARDGSQILPDPGETDHPDLLTRMIEARGR